MLTLRIIGSGFGRTGTTSLKEALETLGFGPCHHAVEVLAHPAQIPGWCRALAGEPVDWSIVLGGYRSQIDWPGAHFWRELAAAYPAAKVIHSVRPAEAWWKSYSATIGRHLSGRRDGHLSADLQPWFDDLDDMIGRQTFGSTVLDKGAGIAAYLRRTEEVRAAIPPSRLLVFDVTEGWQPLCGFLGVPVPDRPFPQLNSTAQFWDSVGVANPHGGSLLRRLTRRFARLRLVDRLALRRLSRPPHDLQAVAALEFCASARLDQFAML